MNLRLLLPLVALASCASRDGLIPMPETMTAVRFDDAPAGAPVGWRIETTNPRVGNEQATWSIKASEGAPSPPNVLSLTDAKAHKGQTFNLCWSDAVALADVDITVRVRADAGEEDQGGGPAWRIKGTGDYYCARWNPLEDNFRVYSVVNGERLQLDTARVPHEPDAWHTIRVRQIGADIQCWYDGEMLLEVSDAKVTGAGGVGLWTKADAATSFDDFGYAAIE